ncbi:MAG: hypothetical protein WB562_09875, partial [Candidatus Sulfotelmatobacter sp.]
MQLRRGIWLLAALAATSFPASPVFAQEGPLDSAQPKGVTVDEIIHHFAAREKEFKEARDKYTYRQDIKVVTLDG